jgi:hypothetical protein
MNHDEIEDFSERGSCMGRWFGLDSGPDKKIREKEIHTVAQHKKPERRREIERRRRRRKKRLKQRAKEKAAQR